MEPLTVRLAVLDVLDERVEGMAVVRHLPASVVPLRRSQEGGLRSRSRMRLARREQWWPGFGAGAVAAALAAPVLLEEIERAAAVVDKDAAELRLSGME